MLKGIARCLVAEGQLEEAEERFQKAMGMENARNPGASRAMLEYCQVSGESWRSERRSCACSCASLQPGRRKDGCLCRALPLATRKEDGLHPWHVL